MKTISFIPLNNFKVKSILLMLLIFFAGCAQETTSSSEYQTTQTSNEESQAISMDSGAMTIPFLTKNITGLSGTVYQLSMPSNWIEEVNPQSYNENFEFLISDQKKQEFVGSIIENKKDFADIDAYTQLVSKMLEDTTGGELKFKNEWVSGKKIKVAEFPAIVEGTKISYRYHIVETKNSYVQIYGWTFTRMFESSRERLKTILNSFEEK